MASIGQLVEELCIANIKLYEVCDKKADAAKNPSHYTKSQLIEIMDKDIQLCKRRAQLKTAIDKALNEAIISGDISVTDEVKQYGNG